MKLAFIVEEHELAALQPGVIVEMWRRVMTTGSGKRKFAAEFTPEEQEKVKELYKTVYGWLYKKVGGTGIPKEHRMTFDEYRLLQRACNFFGTY